MLCKLILAQWLTGEKYNTALTGWILGQIKNKTKKPQHLRASLSYIAKPG